MRMSGGTITVVHSAHQTDTNGLAYNARKGMHDLDHWAKPGDQLAISIPIGFKRFRLIFKQLKDIIGRTTAPKLVGQGVLVEFHANLLAVVVESFYRGSLETM